MAHEEDIFNDWPGLKAIILRDAVTNYRRAMKDYRIARKAHADENFSPESKIKLDNLYKKMEKAAFQLKLSALREDSTP